MPATSPGRWAVQQNALERHANRLGCLHIDVIKRGEKCAKFVRCEHSIFFGFFAANLFDAGEEVHWDVVAVRGP